MTHGSLFSGIGGFDLAAECMGWDNLFHCEWNTFGQKVLHHYWPNAEQFTDIKKSNFTKYAGKIDILTGGFPCQPYSVAGKRKGKEDERHLWPEMLRAIREIRPRWIVGENVRGLVNWNGGLVFDEVQTDLAAAGYKVLPVILPAAGVGAVHRRDRVWFIAHANGAGFQTTRTEQQTAGIEQYGKLDRLNPDANGKRLERRPNKGGIGGERTGSKKQSTGFFLGKWEGFPTESPIRGRNDGFSGGLDGISLSEWRRESIKAFGNAIVPQVALQIFKIIEGYEKIKKV
jgi:DNA (cytosine-5)-methyltransferase 1